MTIPENSTTSRISFEDQTLLETCIEIELLNRDLYTLFAENYGENHEAAYLWSKTAREEQNHADQFSLALKLKKGLSLKTGISQQAANSLVSNLKKTIEKIKHTPLTLLDALLFAIKLEQHLADFHLICIAEFDDVSFGNMFKAMMASDHGHIESIEAFHKKLLAKQA